MSALLCCLALMAANDEKYLAWVAEPADVAALPKSVGTPLSADDLAKLVRAEPTMPFDDAKSGVRAASGAIWVPCSRGVMYLAPGAARWRLFHSRAWLPADDVQGLSLAADGSVIVQTVAGFGRLKQQSTTLDAKMATINSMLQKYHVREGLVAEIYSKEAGRFDRGHVQPSSDNDGLWTSLYVAAEAFRYAVTGDESAKKNARRSLEALMFLERITGIPGFAARSIVPITDDPKKYGGEWHRSADGRWWWKGDTSSDEVDGHFFAYSIYYDVAATEEEKKEIREYVARITDHILDHNFYYVGPPGKPTTWGVWAPEKLNHDLKWIGDRGLNSLEILSHLKVASRLVGKPRYAEAAKQLIEKESYATNTVEQKRIFPAESVNHSDDELAFLAYYPLVIYERDPALRKVYLASIRRTWRIERPEHSPLFNFIYAAALQANEWTDPLRRPEKALVAPQEYDQAECLEWFCDVLPDTTVWRFKNSGRRDVGSITANRFNQQRGTIALPPSE
ncbi:MAG TPA: hypothetical protein VGJ26_14680, partial [Pirellulales bacterium]